jgi:hypothetical protein
MAAKAIPERCRTSGVALGCHCEAQRGISAPLKYANRPQRHFSQSLFYFY